MNGKIVNKVGWLASIMTMLMFSSYFDQIRLNLTGCPGSIVLPIATIFNCLGWISYALLKEKTDWPIFLCNLLGVIVAVLTVISAVLAR